MPHLRTFGLFLGLLLSLACTRGPDIPEGSSNDDEEPATMASSMATMEAANPHASMAANPHAGISPQQMGARRGPPSIDPDAPTLAGIRWSTQEPLTFRPPTRPMRNAEYFVSGSDGEAELTVFHFPGMGGAVRANINRWVGQMQTREGGPITDPDIQTKTVNGFEVTTVDVRGVFTAGMGTGSGPQAAARLLGAIIVGPDGPVFFKMVGPEDTVTSAESAFEALIESFEPAAS